LALRLVLIGHYAVLGGVGLAVTQGGWSRKGEPIRWLLMGGGISLLAAAVLLLVRRPWSWWGAVVSLVAALGAFAGATIGFVWAGDPSSWDANVGYLAPIAATMVILVWLFALYAVLCALAALVGLIALLLPATRQHFRSRGGEAPG